MNRDKLEYKYMYSGGDTNTNSDVGYNDLW